jgi:hypothetical protein
MWCRKINCCFKIRWCFGIGYGKEQTKSSRSSGVEKYSITHQYDAGAAWENLALEASSRELVAHGMQGFDYEKSRIDLEIPDNFDVMSINKQVITSVSS